MNTNIKRHQREWSTIPDGEEQNMPVASATNFTETQQLGINKTTDSLVSKNLPIQSNEKSKIITDLQKIDFDCKKLNGKARKYSLKICSWKVNGINTIIENGGVEYLLAENADIIAIQGTKCPNDAFSAKVKLPDYHYNYCDNSITEQYGMALFTKDEPLQILYHQEVPGAGIITAEFHDFWLVSVDAPAAGHKIQTQEVRMEWDNALKMYVGILDKKKPVIICGNMNVAHEEQDVSNHADMMDEKAIGLFGCTTLERRGMKNLLAAGFCDTYRELNPQGRNYTYWPSENETGLFNNIGCRYDYFLVSRRIIGGICDNIMRSTVQGSQHCPIVLFARL